MVIDYLDEIVGQEAAKRFIRTAIKKDNLYNLLFVGPRGVGKRTMAFALAKTLGCPPKSQYFNLITPIPSKIKDRGDKIEEYSRSYLPDNVIVQAEDRASILIEQIRNLDERLMHMPGKETKRVVLILEADQMTDEAANCFLKTLEEPPIDTVFILTSSRPEYLLPTIRSRCRTIPFVYLNADQIKKVVFEGTDDFILGSAGEILTFRDGNIVENAIDVFKKMPVTLKAAANLARVYERKRIIEIFYPLLLLYRMVLYRKLNLAGSARYEREIAFKAKKVPTDKLVNAVEVLNEGINLLERNPNRLLHLFYVFLRLP
ncbi:MAG: AAA family ATPase [candidate division WOR-3 bacterium]|nr:MAG: AAA family ATPase [candidate division WOR-3 bacterium]